MYAILHTGFKLPFHLHPNQACGELYGFQCPTKVNQHETLHISLPIKAQYPKIAVLVRTKLLDENNTTIMCVQVPARIVGNSVLESEHELNEIGY